METVEAFCDKCNIQTIHEVTDMREGIDCWMIVVLECTKCGHTQEVKMNS